VGAKPNVVEVLGLVLISHEVFSVSVPPWWILVAALSRCENLRLIWIYAVLFPVACGLNAFTPAFPRSCVKSYCWGVAFSGHQRLLCRAGVQLTQLPNYPFTKFL
jgi:hypothetical protein